MVKIAIGFVIGFSVFYLYNNPGDISGMMEIFKGAVNTTAKTVVEVTDGY